MALLQILRFFSFTFKSKLLGFCVINKTDYAHEINSAYKTPGFN